MTGANLTLQGSPANLPQVLAGLVLVGVRISGLFVFAPLFSSAAIPPMVKAVLTLAFTLCVGPSLVVASGVHAELGIGSVLAECAVALVFGLTVSFLMELANSAGQLVGMQTSFTLVNLIDPNTRVETTLFSQMFQLLVVTLMVTAGLDRVLLLGLLRTFQTLPPGGFSVRPDGLQEVLPIAGGIFLAAFQLVTPLLAATLVVEIAIALMAKLSPQLPVMALTIPAKTLVSFLVLISCLAFWTRFFESWFARLLDSAQLAVTHCFSGGT
jgi:flagellar biosynthetic protein FliR